MNKVAFVHIINENLGDASCCPKRHFKVFEGCPEVDFRFLPVEMHAPPWTLIVGGGGMLHPGIDTWIQTRSKAQRVILWGVGLNYHDGHPLPPWQPLLRSCALATIRDVRECGPGVFFCPCPSCLAPDFRSARDITPTQDVVCFEHYQRRLGFTHPTRDNLRLGTKWNFEKAVAFLASGRRVITNSFHGAYWAALLGRPVLVYKPFSTRFRSGLLFRDFAGTPEEVRAWLTRDVPAPFPDYLDNCRAINLKTFDRVQQILETPA